MQCLQGVGKWTGFMTTNGLYRSAVASNTLVAVSLREFMVCRARQYRESKFPRLSATSNANNNSNNTLNMFDRSYLKLRYVEMYYYLPRGMVGTRLGFISKVKLYARGTEHVFTADHLDKADAAAYGTTQPLTRALQLGAAVTF